MVCVFARKINGSLTSLVKQINEEVGKNKDKRLSAFVVFLTDDLDETKPQVEKLADKEKIHNVPLTIVEPAAGPPNYKVNQDAEVTVLLWKGQKVQSNHAFKAGELNSQKIAAVIKDIPKLLE